MTDHPRQQITATLQADITNENPAVQARLEADLHERLQSVVDEFTGFGWTVTVKRGRTQTRQPTAPAPVVRAAE